MWPDGTYPMLFTESSCVCKPNFKPVAQFFFLAKVHFWLVLKNGKGCGHINMFITFPGDADPNILVCGLTSTVQA